jgi:hypothetical protein
LCTQKSVTDGLHGVIQIGLALKANAVKFRHDDVTVLDLDAIREAAERLEQVGI